MQSEDGKDKPGRKSGVSKRGAACLGNHEAVSLFMELWG